MALSPRKSLPRSEEGIIMLRLNVSVSSASVSLVIGTLIIVLVVPAVKVAVIAVEL